MRPQPLYPLFAPVTSLKGVGPRLGKLFEKLAGPNVADLLWHLPSGLVDRRFCPKIAEAPDQTVASLIVTVEAHQPPRNPRLPYRVVCADETGTLDLVFFHAHTDWLQKSLPIGQVRVISGKVEYFSGKPQISHPDHIAPMEELAQVCTIEATYPLTAGLSAKQVQRAAKAALARLPELPEWQDAALLKREGWPSFKAALESAHAPESAALLSPLSPARRRLAYDEILASQLALGLVRRAHKKLMGRPMVGDGHIRAKLKQALPFTLTGAQQRVLAEIDDDMRSDQRMLRLLQGDVGSGKTVVALFAVAAAAECGAQAALMAPTEILARQHYATLAPLAEKAGLSVALLTGRDKGKAREKILHSIASGEIALAIGTHALFQEDVVFHDLGVAVIDEQHRFGVHQRLTLASKGKGVDILVMTATPIPRTLALAAYGDLDISRLDEKPAGRKPVETRVLPLARLDEVEASLGRVLEQGGKAFWVCPLIEESEVVDLAAATDRRAHLSERYPGRVHLVHGRMKAAEKDAAMTAFVAPGPAILVATTVIEVGVDVPAATVMVIEHAERFGLAQLHQLRGRIGRGEKASSCLLLYDQPLGETAKARLKILRESEDGFRIAEEDLRLRGAGEMLGAKQSGLPDFRMADFGQHGDLLEIARDDTKLILEKDPELATPRGAALRSLLYLFAKDAVVATLRSG